MASDRPSPRPGSNRGHWAGALRQALAFAVLGGALFAMFHLTSANLQSRGIHSGFDFLWRPSPTPISNSPVSFEAGVDSYARAFAAGALNSVKLSLAAIVAATVIGVAVGLGRLFPNALARALCAGYVEGMRNVPVLLHVVFWYGLILHLPATSDAPSWAGVLASNRGIHLAWFVTDSTWWWSIGLVTGCIAAWRLLRPRPADGRVRPGWRWRWMVLALAASLPWMLRWRLPALEWPTVDGLEVQGGLFMTPEFCALFIGISLYTAAFVAEIVRASVTSVDRGQWEATSALGLSRGTTLGRVVLPQALRVGLPPLSSEYMGIFKNSTLAVAVGYQDFMAVSNSMLTDTGQAVEVMAIVMLFYAVVSLLVSSAMHGFEYRNMRWDAK
ncbi:MAG TPA: ABC transporter permease subunit [Burkholderiaceae bacterium]